MIADPDEVTVRRLVAVTEGQMVELSGLLIDCVEGGASVSFMSPLSHDRALSYWRGIAEEVAHGDRAILVAEENGSIVGSVQLVLRQPENQPHRADVSKMLVYRRVRRRGVGEALLRVTDAVARSCGKSLMVLDTGSPEAGRLYARMGWQRVGVVPGFALLPHGGTCDTTFFYRCLD